MINSVVISGCYKGIELDELLLKVEELENHQIVRIYVSKELQDQITKHIKENDLMGIKGYIELDDVHRIIIIATKITFLSSKKSSNF